MSVPESKGMDKSLKNECAPANAFAFGGDRVLHTFSQSNVWFSFAAVALVVMLTGCEDQSEWPKPQASASSNKLAKPRFSHRVRAVSARLANPNSPASRRQNLTASLQAFKTHPPKTARIKTTRQQLAPPEMTLVQLGGDVPIPVLPQTPGQTQLPIELIPTPKGVLDGGEKNSDAPLAKNPVSGVPDQRMAKNPDSTVSPADPSDKPASKPNTPIPTKTPGLEPVTFTNWQKPDVTLFITGQQNGYIEPCGCTGLDKQKGGVARRMTFMQQLRDKGWNLIPIDAGNQIRRIGQQAVIKFGWSTEALKKMKYDAVGFGPADLRLNSIDLLQVCAADDPATALYIGGNVVLFDDKSYVPPVKMMEKNGLKIGITTILDPKKIDFPLTEDVTVKPVAESAKEVLDSMHQADFKVICFYGEEDAAKALMKEVQGFDLIIAAGGYGEPHYEPQIITGSKTKLIDTGYKGMYAGLVGLYKNSAFNYCRVPLTHEFEDAPEMRKIMRDYQDQLKSIGLDGLGLNPSPHLSGEQFVGTATCGKCHTSALDTWESTPHADATDSIVTPKENRGDVPRHFDPECISCHVTGWNPQLYSPFESGYEKLQVSQHLLGNGCENCHGPGKSHSDAEEEDSGVSEAEKLKLRKSMQLPLEKAKEQCMKCHDLDNSPDFHTPGAFEDEYWPEVEHYGMD